MTLGLQHKNYLYVSRPYNPIVTELYNPLNFSNFLLTIYPLPTPDDEEYTP